MARFVSGYCNATFMPRQKNHVKSSSVADFFLDLCDACLYKNALTTVRTVAPTTNINNNKNCYTPVKSGFGRFLFPARSRDTIHA
jgi:hypothetical protein